MTGLLALIAVLLMHYFRTQLLSAQYPSRNYSDNSSVYLHRMNSRRHCVRRRYAASPIAGIANSL